MSVNQTSIEKPINRFDLFFRKSLFRKLSAIQQAELIISDPLGEVTLGKYDESSVLLTARLSVADISFYRKVALGGSIGAAESYMDGLWQTNDLTEVIQILVRNRDLLDAMEGGFSLIANQLLRVWHFANRNNLQGSRRNIAAHYDLGNDLFELFLDEHRMYSSATYNDSSLSLDNASTAKLSRICSKLDLKATDHLLEIGSGWGGFAAYAATHFGCRVTTITISEQQYEAANQRVQKAGVSQNVDVQLIDYRDMTGSYDKLVSIEMIEAVGHQYLDTYMKQCSNLLKPHGLALIQAITIEDHRYQTALNSVDFIKRYIFPGSFIPCVSAILGSAGKVTDLRLINLEDQGESYALTIKTWRERFMANLNAVRDLGYPESFIRMWEFYLAYCEGGFLEKSTSNVQMLFAKPGNRRHQWLANEK